MSLQCTEDPSTYNIIATAVQDLRINKGIYVNRKEDWMAKIFEQNKDLKILYLEGKFKIEEVYQWNKLESLCVISGNLDWNKYPSIKELRIL